MKRILSPFSNVATNKRDTAAESRTSDKISSSDAVHGLDAHSSALMSTPARPRRLSLFARKSSNQGQQRLQHDEPLPLSGWTPSVTHSASTPSGIAFPAKSNQDHPLTSPTSNTDSAAARNRPRRRSFKDIFTRSHTAPALDTPAASPPLTPEANPAIAIRRSRRQSLPQSIARAFSRTESSSSSSTPHPNVNAPPVPEIPANFKSSHASHSSSPPHTSTTQADEQSRQRLLPDIRVGSRLSMRLDPPAVLVRSSSTASTRVSIKRNTQPSDDNDEDDYGSDGTEVDRTPELTLSASTAHTDNDAVSFTTAPGSPVIDDGKSGSTYRALRPRLLQLSIASKRPVSTASSKGSSSSLSPPYTASSANKFSAAPAAQRRALTPGAKLCYNRTMAKMKQSSDAISAIEAAAMSGELIWPGSTRRLSSRSSSYKQAQPPQRAWSMSAPATIEVDIMRRLVLHKIWHRTLTIVQEMELGSYHKRPTSTGPSPTPSPQPSPVSPTWPQPSVLRLESSTPTAAHVDAMLRDDSVAPGVSARPKRVNHWRNWATRPPFAERTIEIDLLSNGVTRVEQPSSITRTGSSTRRSDILRLSARARAYAGLPIEQRRLQPDFGQSQIVAAQPQVQLGSALADTVSETGPAVTNDMKRLSKFLGASRNAEEDGGHATSNSSNSTREDHAIHPMHVAEHKAAHHSLAGETSQKLGHRADNHSIPHGEASLHGYKDHYSSLSTYHRKSLSSGSQNQSRVDSAVSGSMQSIRTGSDITGSSDLLPSLFHAGTSTSSSTMQTSNDSHSSEFSFVEVQSPSLRTEAAVFPRQSDQLDPLKRTSRIANDSQQINTVVRHPVRERSNTVSTQDSADQYVSDDAGACELPAASSASSEPRVIGMPPRGERESPTLTQQKTAKARRDHKFAELPVNIRQTQPSSNAVGRAIPPMTRSTSQPNVDRRARSLSTTQGRTAESIEIEQLRAEVARLRALQSRSPSRPSSGVQSQDAQARLRESIKSDDARRQAAFEEVQTKKQRHDQWQAERRRSGYLQMAHDEQVRRSAAEEKRRSYIADIVQPPFQRPVSAYFPGSASASATLPPRPSSMMSPAGPYSDAMPPGGTGIYAPQPLHPGAVMHPLFHMQAGAPFFAPYPMQLGYAQQASAMPSPPLTPVDSPSYYNGGNVHPLASSRGNVQSAPVSRESSPGGHRHRPSDTRRHSTLHGANAPRLSDLASQEYHRSGRA